VSASAADVIRRPDMVRFVPLTEAMMLARGFTMTPLVTVKRHAASETDVTLLTTASS